MAKACAQKSSACPGLVRFGYEPDVAYNDC